MWLLGWITDTVRSQRFATRTLLPSGVADTPVGALPTVMGKPTAVLVAVSITDTVLSRLFVTKTLLPSEVAATPKAPLPTITGEPITVLVAVSITDTVPPTRSAT